MYKRQIRSGAIADAIENGDESIRNLVSDACRLIGYSVVNIIHLLAPDRIVLGGGLVEAMEDLILQTVTETANQNVMEVYRGRFEIVAARLGDDAGVMGAAAWAKNELNG